MEKIMRMPKVIIIKNFLLFVSLFAVCFTAGCSRADTGPKVSLDTIRSDDQVYPMVVLGGGVGGLTAALYCLQAQVPTLLIEGSKPGGALSQSHSVRNWPGVHNAPGADIITSIKNQVLQSGATLVAERVISVDFSQWPRVIETASVQDPSIRRTIKALSVIIATGTEPNFLGIPGEQDFWGKGVSNCAVCEGSLFKNKRVLIVGGGDAAIVEASYLSGIAQEVVLVVRGSSLRAKDTKQRDVVLAKPHVKVLYNTQLQGINGNQQGVTGVVLNNNQTRDTDGVFLAIGSQPNTGLFKQQLSLDERGFITLANHQESSVSGVFAVGDVCDSDFVQAITAAGDGCKAALQGINFLKKLGYAPIPPQPVTLPAVLSSKTMSKQVGATIGEGLKKISINDQKADLVADGKVHEIVTIKDFERLVVSSKIPVVLDVFATWCGPCQQMAPIIDRLAVKYAGKIIFVKFNIENQTCSLDVILGQLQAKSVQSVPSFLLVRAGKEQKRLVGGMRVEAFERAISDTFGLV